MMGQRLHTKATRMITRHILQWGSIRAFPICVWTLSALAIGCSWVPKGELALDLGVKDRGVASWYGEPFHGRLAANGEVFNMWSLTAAHRRLPLGSVVRVINFANGKQVRVRITDRGPYIDGRMLDLSYAAAQELGMVAGGLAPVQIEVIGDHRLVLPAVESDTGGVQLLQLRPDPVDREMRQTSAPLVVSRVRSHGNVWPLLPREALHERRLRRVTMILATDYTAHTTVPVLVLL